MIAELSAALERQAIRDEIRKLERQAAELESLPSSRAAMLFTFSGEHPRDTAYALRMRARELGLVLATRG